MSHSETEHVTKTGTENAKDTGQVAIESVNETHHHTEMMTGIVLPLVCLHS